MIRLICWLSGGHEWRYYYDTRGGEVVEKCGFCYAIRILPERKGDGIGC